MKTRSSVLKELKCDEWSNFSEKRHQLNNISHLHKLKPYECTRSKKPEIVPGLTNEMLKTGKNEVRLDNFKKLSPGKVRQILESMKMTTKELRYSGYPLFDGRGRIWIERTPWDNRDTMSIVDKLYTSERNDFVSSPTPDGRNDLRSDKTYSLDCDVVETIAGLGLARLVLADIDGNVVLNLLVQPPAKVVDYRTEFSGLTRETLSLATESWESARNKLFKFINSSTNLIGHNLVRAFKILRLVHGNVIDTSLLFRKPGKEDRKRLKDLADIYLKRKIQLNNIHCSKEDAITSLDLIKYRINCYEEQVFVDFLPAL